MRTSMAALMIVALVAAGCSSPPAEPPAPEAPVVLPGRPGETGDVVRPDQVDPNKTKETPNSADVDYMTNMIPHHQQAAVMTKLVAEKAADEQVRAIAERISVSQDAEVKLMGTWLTKYGKPIPGTDPSGHSGHGMAEHAAMPGMATAEQLNQLRAATGAEFEKMFLKLMIAHHQGALTMAEAQLSGGVETKAQELAQEVITGQSAEIERMRTLSAKY
jgi:uncharacterized protein (DUF305 family)